MQLIECLLTKNDCYKAGRTIIPQGIVVHSTGANNPNVNRYVPLENGSSMHWNKPGIKKCVHAFVGYLPDKTIGTCQTLPWNARGWHVGAGKKGSYNNTHISFEICEDNLRNKDYFEKVFQEAAELCVYLCKLYNLDPGKDGVIVSHHESYLRGYGGNHADCDHWLKIYNQTMDDFRNRVKELFDMTTTEFNKIFDQWQKEEATAGYSDFSKSEKIPEFIEETKISDGTRVQQLVTREQVFAIIKRYHEYMMQKLKELNVIK